MGTRMRRIRWVGEGMEVENEGKDSWNWETFLGRVET